MTLEWQQWRVWVDGELPVITYHHKLNNAFCSYGTLLLNLRDIWKKKSSFYIQANSYMMPPSGEKKIWHYIPVGRFPICIKPSSSQDTSHVGPSQFLWHWSAFRHLSLIIYKRTSHRLRVNSARNGNDIAVAMNLPQTEVPNESISEWPCDQLSQQIW